MILFIRVVIIQIQMVKAIDKLVYDRILERYNLEEPKEMNYKLAFLPHFILKAVVLTLYLFSGQITSLINNEPTYELISIFLVIDFWVTKNINGRKMIGIRWFFENDEYGVERFKFECRANPELNSSVNGRLFWIVLVVYALLPAVFIITAFLIVPNLTSFSPAILGLNLAIVSSSMSNIFFFYRASEAAGERQERLRQQMGLQFVRGMEDATIVSYL